MQWRISGAEFEGDATNFRGPFWEKFPVSRPQFLMTFLKSSTRFVQIFRIFTVFNIPHMSPPLKIGGYNRKFTAWETVND